MCKIRGEQLGGGFPPYRNYQEGEGGFRGYILPIPSASSRATIESKSIGTVVPKEKKFRKPRAKRAKKTLIQNGNGKKRKPRRKQTASKPKKRKSKKRPKQTGGVRHLKQAKKKRTKVARKRVYKKGVKSSSKKIIGNLNF